MIKVDRALQEVWDWKDEIYRMNKGNSVADLVKLIKREASLVDIKRKKKPTLHKS